MEAIYRGFEVEPQSHILHRVEFLHTVNFNVDCIAQEVFLNHQNAKFATYILVKILFQ